jgi:hypothetical protein
VRSSCDLQAIANAGADVWWRGCGGSTHCSPACPSVGTPPESRKASLKRAFHSGSGCGVGRRPRLRRERALRRCGGAPSAPRRELSPLRSRLLWRSCTQHSHAAPRGLRTVDQDETDVPKNGYICKVQAAYVPEVRHRSPSSCHRLCAWRRIQQLISSRSYIAGQQGLKQTLFVPNHML